jgi:hypothetical protein
MPEVPDPTDTPRPGVPFLPLDVSSLVAMIRSHRTGTPVPPVAALGHAGPAVPPRPAVEPDEDPERWDGMA